MLSEPPLCLPSPEAVPKPALLPFNCFCRPSSCAHSFSKVFHSLNLGPQTWLLMRKLDESTC